MRPSDMLKHTNRYDPIIGVGITIGMISVILQFVMEAIGLSRRRLAGTKRVLIVRKRDADNLCGVCVTTDFPSNASPAAAYVEYCLTSAPMEQISLIA